MIQMTISHVYKKITEAMETIQSINVYEMSSSAMRRYNQKSLNTAYRQLDNLRAELEREHIRNKQKRTEAMKND